MNDLHDIVTAARPPPTPEQLWRSHQRRAALLSAILGFALFMGGVAWIIRPDHDAGPGIGAILLGVVALCIGGWFGLRALVGEPPEG